MGRISSGLKERARGRGGRGDPEPGVRGLGGAGTPRRRRKRGIKKAYGTPSGTDSPPSATEGEREKKLFCLKKLKYC